MRYILAPITEPECEVRFEDCSEIKCVIVAEILRCLICLAQIGGVEASMNPLCDANENSGMIVYLTLQHGCIADVRLA